MQRRFSMKVTVDANVLFACLIKDSTTRRLFFNPSLSLFSPEFIVDELLSHLFEIQKKSGLSEEELYHLINANHRKPISFRYGMNVAYADKCINSVVGHLTS